MSNTPEPKIIYEDGELLVLDKPSGWITNDASTTGNQPTVQHWLIVNYKSKIVNLPELRSGIVHRLDKETSGILLIAKTKDSFENLQKQFKDRVVQKTYTALVHGKVKQKAGIIDAPVGRLPWRRDRFGVLAGGREAVTDYKVIKFYKGHSLLELKPKTGRTHQIRIHLKHLGHPIVADTFYAGRKTARADRKWCSRLFLHASAISFKHPKTSEVVSFQSQLPADLASALHGLSTSLN